MSETRVSAAMLVIALLGLALRVTFGLGYWVGKPLTKDEREYLSLARSLSHGAGFVYDDALLREGIQPVGRAPGYPLFLAAIGGGSTVVNTVPPVVKVTQAVAGALGILAMGWTAAQLAGPAAGTMSALIAAFYPPLVWIAAYALSEALAWPVGVVLILLFDRACERRRPILFAAAGAVAAVAALVRPSLLAFVPLACIWLIWRRGPRSAAAFTLGVLLLVLPWTVRNYRQDGRFVLIASEGGVTFWTGNHPAALGEGDLAANPELARLARNFRSEHADLTEPQMEPLYYADAGRWIARNPGAWLVLEGRKLFHQVFPVGPSYRLHSRLYYATSVISYGLLLPFGLAGAWRLGARWSVSPALWLLVGSSVLVALIFFPQERFRIAVIDPALIICAASLATRKHVTIGPALESW